MAFVGHGQVVVFAHLSSTGRPYDQQLKTIMLGVCTSYGGCLGSGSQWSNKTCWFVDVTIVSLDGGLF